MPPGHKATTADLPCCVMWLMWLVYSLPGAFFSKMHTLAGMACHRNVWSLVARHAQGGWRPEIGSGARRAAPAVLAERSGGATEPVQLQLAAAFVSSFRQTRTVRKYTHIVMSSLLRALFVAGTALACSLPSRAPHSKPAPLGTPQ